MKWPFTRQKTQESSASVASIRADGLHLSGVNYPAMENSAFWGCVTKLCRMYGTMPWKLYSDAGEYPKEIRGVHPVKRLMEHPAPYLNSFEWRYIMGFQFELFSQAFAIIERSGDLIVALHPVSPNLMASSWRDGQLYWRYAGDGSVFADRDVLRFVNVPTGYDSVLSLVEYTTADLDTIRQGKNLQRSYYKNGASVGGVVYMPQFKGAEGRSAKELQNEFIASFRKGYTGAENGHKTIFLNNEFKYEPLHLEDGDFAKLEAAQKWTEKEVYTRFFGPDAGATYANAEDRGIEEMKSVLPRFIVWETAFNELLEGELFTKFNLNSLLRASSTTQMNCIVQGVNNGLYTINEGRRLLDFPPIDGGDIIRVPLNYGILNPDGSINNPNQIQNPSSNPFDWPSDVRRESLSEKRRRDRVYLQETQTVSKTNRSKIERIMREQIRDYTSKVRELVATGAPVSDVLTDFEKYAHEVEKDYGNKYVEVFKAVMEKLAPIVVKAVNNGGTLNKDALEAYAGKFGQSMSGRFATNRVKDVRKCVDPEDYDDMYDDWFSVPAEESVEETNRAGNAFQVFMFSQLGLQYMHVVSSSDACEFCHELDGKVVEVNGNILSKGDKGTDGAGNVRVINKNYKHPPFHGHCNCGVAPGK